MNKKFKVDQEVVCTWGANKGKIFMVKAILNNGYYSCILKDENNNKYYQYDDDTLEEVCYAG